MLGEAAQPLEPSVDSSNQKKKKILMVAIAKMVTIAIATTAAFLHFSVFKSASQTAAPEQKEMEPSARVFGESSGKLPYAPVDEENIVSRSLDKSGGVLTDHSFQKCKGLFGSSRGRGNTRCHC